MLRTYFPSNFQIAQGKNFFFLFYYLTLIIIKNKIHIELDRYKPILSEEEKNEIDKQFGDMKPLQVSINYFYFFSLFIFFLIFKSIMLLNT